MWIRRTAYHHQTIGENLTAFSFQTKNYLNQLAQLGLEGKKGLAQMNNVLNDQSAMMAINDCFWVMGWTFLALLLFLPFGYKKREPHHKLPRLPVVCRINLSYILARLYVSQSCF